MRDHPPNEPSDRDEALLQRLREVTRERDPVPEHVTAAARSALAASGRTEPRRADGEAPQDGR
jgi:hypothetical protein